MFLLLSPVGWCELASILDTVLEDEVLDCASPPPSRSFFLNFEEASLEWREKAEEDFGMALLQQILTKTRFKGNLESIKRMRFFVWCLSFLGDDRGCSNVFTCGMKMGAVVFFVKSNFIEK